MDEIKTPEENVATPGLSAIIARRVEAQAREAVAAHEIAITITHVAEYDNPHYPGTYRVEFEGELDNDQRQALLRDPHRFPVVGLSWFVFKPTFSLGTAGDDFTAATPSAAPSSPAAPDPSEPAIAPDVPPAGVDPRDARIAELEAQIARLIAQLKAAAPAAAEAIREEIRTFPAEPGTRYFVGQISDVQWQADSAKRFDEFERDCTLMAEHFLGFDAGQHPRIWHVARGKRRTAPEENGANAKTFAVVDVPESPSKEAVRGQIVEPVGPLMSTFVNLMRRNPLIEAVWTHGDQAVYENMIAVGNQRAVDFIFDRLEAQRRALALAGDDLE